MLIRKSPQICNLPFFSKIGLRTCKLHLCNLSRLFGSVHSHITGKILLYTTTRRKIPNILGNWHMKFNSPLLKLSYMMLNNGELKLSILLVLRIKIMLYQLPTCGNWNCVYCEEIKSCYINSPHVEDWNSKFCVQYGNVSPSPRRKRDWVKFPICHSWQIFHHLWLRHYVVKNPIPFSPR